MINIQISEALAGQTLPILQDEEFFIDAAQRTLSHVGGLKSGGPGALLSEQEARLEDANDLQKQDLELTIVLTDDAEVHELNRQYREVDAPTDVLSFPVGETDLDSGNFYLGDIVLSIPRAEAQAKAEGRSLEDELRLLVVHGVLHLLGYDHADEAEQAEMWAEQAAILCQNGKSC
jgi:probable rRNA maturation factor